MVTLLFYPVNRHYCIRISEILLVIPSTG